MNGITSSNFSSFWDFQRQTDNHSDRLESLKCINYINVHNMFCIPLMILTNIIILIIIVLQVKAVYDSKERKPKPKVINISYNSRVLMQNRNVSLFKTEYVIKEKSNETFNAKMIIINKDSFCEYCWNRIKFYFNLPYTEEPYFNNIPLSISIILSFVITTNGISIMILAEKPDEKDNTYLFCDIVAAYMVWLIFFSMLYLFKFMKFKDNGPDFSKLTRTLLIICVELFFNILSYYLTIINFGEDEKRTNLTFLISLCFTIFSCFVIIVIIFFYSLYKFNIMFN